MGQFIAAILFGVLVLQFRNDYGLAPASTNLSYVRDIDAIGLGAVVFVIFCWLVVAAWSNAVNFTDGLDGLAAGSMAMVLGSYVLVTFFQFVNACAGGAKLLSEIPTGCYQVRDPLDLAIIAVAGGGACLGFLWWNAAPAKIFMGDTGSLALGGLSWRACPSPPAPSSSRSSSAPCSSPRSCRWSSRSRSSAPPDAASSGWRRSTTISNSGAGRRPRSSSDSGC